MEKPLWLIAITNLISAVLGVVDKLLSMKQKKPHAGGRKASGKKKTKK